MIKRPISLTIVGVVWFLIGALGMVGNSVQEHGLQIPDGNFINLFVGVGLLKGWRICRWYALFVAGFAFVFALLFIPWALCHTGELVYHFPFALMRDQRPHQLESLAVIVLFLFSYLIFSGWSFLVLRRNDARNFLTPRTAVTI
jgi:hypothetical protein